MVELLSLLASLRGVPVNHMEEWIKQGKEFSITTVDEQYSIAEVEGDGIYVLKAATKYEDGGIRTTLINDYIASEPGRYFGIQCSDNGREQTAGLVAEFLDNKGYLLRKHMRSWQINNGKLLPISKKNAFCINDHVGHVH